MADPTVAPEDGPAADPTPTSALSLLPRDLSGVVDGGVVVVGATVSPCKNIKQECLTWNQRTCGGLETWAGYSQPLITCRIRTCDTPTSCAVWTCGYQACYTTKLFNYCTNPFVFPAGSPALTAPADLAIGCSATCPVTQCPQTAAEMAAALITGGGAGLGSRPGQRRLRLPP